MKTKSFEIDLTEGNLFLKLLRVSVPLVLSSLLQLLYNAADLIVCGKFGSEHSVAAVSATASLYQLYIQLLIGLSVGSNVLMARCYGAKDRERGQRVVYTAMVFALVSGVVIGIVGATTSRFFLRLMETPEEVLELSASYLTIFFVGLPFTMIYNFGSAIMRATGDTKRPFYFLAFSGILNVGLNLLFVIIFHLDVAGVALATVISQGVSATLVVIVMCRNQGFYHFRFRQIRFSMAEAKEIIVIGVPAGIQGMLFSISNMTIQSSINGFGTATMDGSGASTSLEGFVYASMNSVAQTAGGFVSANYGANKWDHVRRIPLYSCALVLLFWLVTGGIVMCFRTPLLGLYISSEEAFAAAYERLLAVCCTYFLCGIMDTFAHSLRGIGYSALSMSVCLLGVCAFRIVWVAFVFPIPMFHTVFYLLLSYPISWILTGGTEALLFAVLRRHVRKRAEVALAP